MLRANILLTALPVLLARLNAAAVWVNRGYAKFADFTFYEVG
jgi:O-succinylbenzoate synthase